MDKITFSHLQKYLTCQDYFVWHNLNVLENNELEEDMLGIELDFLDKALTSEISFSQIQSKTFDFVEKVFFSKITNEYKNTYSINQKLSVEDKIKATQDALNNQDIDVIINPFFGYEYNNHLVVAQPTIYIKSCKKLSFIKISTSTKRLDLIRMWFDVQVMKKLGVQVQQISLFIIATKLYNKGEVDFYETNYINTSTSPRTLNNSEEVDYFTLLEEIQKFKAGKGHSSGSNELLESHDLNTLILDNEEFDIDHKLRFRSFEIYLDNIIKAKKVNDFEDIGERDVTSWGNNPEFENILKRYRPSWAGFNGKVLGKKKMVEKSNLETLLPLTLEIPILKYFLQEEITIFNNQKLNNVIRNITDSKVIWYDFEAYSLPYAPMDHMLPYSQVIFQVSIIETLMNKNSEIISEKGNNIVLDPYKPSLDNFVKIIESVYQDDANYYVVYNKSYENTHIKKMAILLEHFKHPSAQAIMIKVNEMIEKTIDLADYFKVESKKLDAQKLCIIIPELKGKYSIKFIQKYVTNNLKNFEYKIKNYQDLNVKNGAEAMDIGTQRAVGLIGDNEWIEKSNWLKEYCENDVKAMIMVFYLIKYIRDNYAS